MSARSEKITHAGMPVRHADAIDTAISDAITTATTNIPNSNLADMAQSTIKGRAAGAGTGDPQDLTAAQARVAAGIDVITSVGDTNYTILATDRHIELTTVFTASRTFTLPAANGVNPGHRIWIAEAVASVITATNTLIVSRAGSDTINGATSVTANTSPCGIELVSDGVSQWTYTFLFGSVGAVLNRLSTTQGDIIYRDASAWATLAPGTSGQLLRTGGAAANPSWATVGGITTIASGSFPAAATLDVTNIPATYAYIVLFYNGASSNTATRQLFIQVSTNNGSSFDATVTNYAGHNFALAATTTIPTTTGTLIETATVAAASTFTGSTLLLGYHGGPRMVSISALTSGTTPYQMFMTYLGSNNAINAIRFLWDGTGNFDAGTYAVYGIS